MMCRTALTLKATGRQVVGHVLGDRSVCLLLNDKTGRPHEFARFVNLVEETKPGRSLK